MSAHVGGAGGEGVAPEGLCTPASEAFHLRLARWEHDIVHDECKGDEIETGGRCSVAVKEGMGRETMGRGETRTVEGEFVQGVVHSLPNS